MSGNFRLAGSTSNNYSQGKRLSDNGVRTVVSNAISSHALPKDTNGIYFVLTSSDVNETSGFCTQYCGWHTRSTISGSDIKYAFVGNPDRCSSACEAQTSSPNGDSGADGMASIMAHETEEAISGSRSQRLVRQQRRRKCRQVRLEVRTYDGDDRKRAYNQTFGGHNWLIQMNWENRAGAAATRRRAERSILTD